MSLDVYTVRGDAVLLSTVKLVRSPFKRDAPPFFWFNVDGGLHRLTVHAHTIQNDDRRVVGELVDSENYRRVAVVGGEDDIRLVCARTGLRRRRA